MRGFLSVLDPPVPVAHLRELGAGPDRGRVEASAVALGPLSVRVDALVGQCVRQEQVLRLISEMAHRINDGAAILQRRTDALRQGRIVRLSTPARREVR